MPYNCSKVTNVFKNNTKIPLIILTISIIIYCTIFSYITIIRHWTFFSTYFDLGCFEQGLWTTLHGSFFWNSPHNASQFGVHNSPILFILLPIYQVLPYAETLLIVQTILLAISAVPLFFIGKKYLSPWGGLTFSLMYLLYPALHGINLFDFHEMAFLPVILFSAIYFLITNRLKYFIILSIIALFIKEDVSLILIMLTAYAIYSKHYTSNLQKNVLLLLIAMYTCWLIISLWVVIPFFNPHGYLFSSRYSIGSDITFYFTNNILLKIAYLILLFLPLCFTPFAAPEILITSFPSFAEILLQENIAYRITTHYSALVIPLLFTSAVCGTHRAIHFFSDKKSQFGKFILPFLLVCSFVSCIFCTPAPISPYTLYYKFSPNSCQYTFTDHSHHLQGILNNIPENASISTQNNLASHLAKRKELYLDYKPGVQYILIDKTNSNVEWLGNEEIQFPREKYTLKYNVENIYLYQLNDF